MNTLRALPLVLVGTVLFALNSSSLTLAQEPPQPPRAGPGGQPGGQPGGGPGEVRPVPPAPLGQPGMKGGGRDGQEGPKGPRQPSNPLQHLEMFRSYMHFAVEYAHFAASPSSAGVASVMLASEILKPRGSEAVIGYFTKILPEVKNDAVARAIRLELIDQYRRNGQADKALEELKTLMTQAAPETLCPMMPGQPKPLPAPAPAPAPAAK